MRWRRRGLAAFALALHCAALTLLPLLHQIGHRDDHVHSGSQTVWLPRSLGEAALESPVDVGDVHQRFDADLDALDLSDAGHFGIAVVDCSLAAYTLAECAAPDSPQHGFGDELAARTHHHHRSGGAPLDPAHGLHSLEHFGLGLVATPTFLLPPPARPLVAAPVLIASDRPGFSPLLAVRARAPPRLA